MAKQEQESVARFTVNGEAYEIDGERLTLGEAAEVESHFDADFDELHGQQATLALVFIAIRRKNPQFTWAEAGRIEIRELVEEQPKRPTKTPARGGSQS